MMAARVRPRSSPAARAAARAHRHRRPRLVLRRRSPTRCPSGAPRSDMSQRELAELSARPSRRSPASSAAAVRRASTRCCRSPRRSSASSSSISSRAVGVGFPARASSLRMRFLAHAARLLVVAAPRPRSCRRCRTAGRRRCRSASRTRPAARLRCARVAPFGFRYQYLAGGVNTGQGWSTWNPDGTFASMYVQDSWAHGVDPGAHLLHAAPVESEGRRRGADRSRAPARPGR